MTCKGQAVQQNLICCTELQSIDIGVGGVAMYVAGRLVFQVGDDWDSTLLEGDNWDSARLTPFESSCVTTLLRISKVGTFHSTLQRIVPKSLPWIDVHC